MNLSSVKSTPGKGENVIIGHSHFIKTIEDIYEAIIETNPTMKFGVAFCEASGDCLIRYDGNSDEMVKKAVDLAKEIGAGHSFVIFMNEGYPVNVLNRLKTVSEVVNIHAATANPIEIIIAENGKGRGIMGVIDGESPKGVETGEKAKERKTFLRAIGYKR
jgi:hypothetical protein